MPINRNTYEQLSQRQHNKCAICGQESVPFVVEHILPVSFGGTRDLSNLVLVCPNCNYHLSNKNTFREVDIIRYLANILEEKYGKKAIHVNTRINDKTRYRADILIIPNRQKKICIEVKPVPTISEEATEEIIKQLEKYREIAPESIQVIAFPGLMRKELYERFNKRGIEVWDQHYISNTFKKEIANVPHPLFSLLFGSPVALKDEEKLIDDLKNIKAGKTHWFEYERLIEKILDNLFGKTLSAPIRSLSDDSKINRKDLILTNYCESGFWSYMRTNYSADYIVIDAKNYVQEIQKKDVLQIGNYLKKHGTGLFGIIVTRSGESNGSNLTRKELWVLQNKLIIVLNDGDIISMLSSKSPETIIQQKIQDFRLSI